MKRAIKISLLAFLSVFAWSAFQAWMDTPVFAPSANVITIDPGNSLFSLTAKKQPGLLFDNDLSQKMDQNGDLSFASPNEWWVELRDSVWSNLKVDFYNETGAGQLWTVIFYDSNRVARGTYGFDGVNFPYQGNYTLPGNPDTISVPIKWVYFKTTNAGNDVRRIRIYGNKVAFSSTFQSYFAAIPIRAPVDPGRAFIGGSALPGKDTNYMKMSGDTAVCGAWRFAGGNAWQYNCDSSALFNKQPFILNHYGDIYTVGGLKFHKQHGVRTMFYINGSSIKTDITKSLSLNSSYPTMAEFLNYHKDIARGADSTDPAAWVNQGRIGGAFASMFGRNKFADTTGYLIRDDGINAASDKTRGRDAIECYEVGNEQDKTWKGDTAYHSPFVFWAQLRAAFDSVKSRDPSMKVYAGALIQMDTAIWKAIVFWDFWKTGVKGNAPMDGVCFNQYHSNKYDGQPSGDEFYAVSPEQFRMKDKMDALSQFRRRWMPNKGIRYTELGYSISGGPYNVVAVPGMPDSVVAAALMIRAYELGSMSYGTLEGLYNYLWQSDGSGNFAGMYAVREKFAPGVGNYIGSDRLPLWWAIATRTKTLYSYKAWGRTLQNGDSTGTYVVMRDHTTDVYKKVVSLWRGTYSGSTVSNYQLNLGRIISAKLVTYQFGSVTGVKTDLAINNGVVTIPSITEMPSYLEVEYKHAPYPYYRQGTKLKRA